MELTERVPLCCADKRSWGGSDPPSHGAQPVAGTPEPFDGWKPALPSHLLQHPNPLPTPEPRSPAPFATLEGCSGTLLLWGMIF